MHAHEMAENIEKKYLPGTDDGQQHIETGDDPSQLTGEMSLFALTEPPRGNPLSKPNTLDLMDGSAFIVPPKSLSGSRQHIFDLNMNSFNDLIFPNQNVQFRSAWDQLVKDTSQNPSAISDITRSSSVDVGIKQTEKTETRQKTVEVKVTRHVDDAIKHKTRSCDDFESKTSDTSDRVTALVDNVNNEEDDVTQTVGEEEETETETEIPAAEAEPRVDDDANDSTVLNLIEKMVELQQNYNHLKTHWDHVGNAISQSFSYLPIPGVFTRMLGLSSSDEQKGLDRRIKGASPRTYLPHGACRRCAERREKQRGKQSARRKDGRHLGNEIITANFIRTDPRDSAIMEEANHSINRNEQCEPALENSLDNVNNTSDEKAKMTLSVSCSGHFDATTKSFNMADSQLGTRQRHLSKMSRDCASINRWLIGMVKENMQRKKIESTSS
ncbi:uncharacterized protein LOC135496298 [Lineus longissimus]|uniref:uncharacterized protein LOC135496298 n=1 Tax=Lineus longissimus TaxID=88925 RepID=UPI00315CA651